MKTYLFPGLCLLAFLFLTSEPVEAQRYAEIMNRQRRPMTFRALQDSMNGYFANAFRGKGSGYKPWKRFEAWSRLHLNPDGTLGNTSYYSYEAVKQTGINQRSANAAALGGSWTSVGPVFNQGTATGIGRPNCIAFHPTNANIVYVGAPIGGIWKGDKSSGSFQWTPLSEGIAGLGVASIALHPSDPNIIYILTGDGNRSDTYSIGLLVSYDGGYSWQETGMKFTRNDQRYAYKLLINPQRPATMYACFNTGLYRSYDGGNSWSGILTGGTVYDVEFKPGDTTRLYACGFGYLATSVNGSWTDKSAYLPAGTRRIALAVSAANSQRVYAYCGTHDSAFVAGAWVGRFKGILRSDDAGSTYTLVCNSPNISGYNKDGSSKDREQSDIDMDIAASPTNANLVFAGTENVWKSTNGCASFGSQATSFWNSGGTDYVHEDINFIAVSPVDGSVYCGSDGGVYRTTDNGSTWVDMGYGLVISQFYRIGVQQANPNIIVNGAQDAAGNVRVGATAEFKELSGGDGMDCMIDEQDDKVIYTTYANGVLYRTLDGGATASAKVSGNLTGNWITPLAMDRYRSDTIYYGQVAYDANGNITSESVYRSFNKGNTWTSIGVGYGSEVLALGVNNTARLYAYSHGNLVSTRNANAAVPVWNSAMGTGYPNPGVLGNAPISDIAVNPTNDKEVWFCMGGYANQKVFRSLDSGAHWTDMSAGLPNVACLSIVYGSNLGIYAGGVYVGTDIGVFYRNDALGGWMPYRNWLPAVPVWDLKMNYNTNTLRAATYGRGIWETPAYTGCDNDINLTTYLEGYHYYQANNTVTTVSPIVFGNGNTVNLKAGNYVQMSPGFVAGNGSYFNASIGPCGAGIPARFASGSLMPTVEDPVSGVRVFVKPSEQTLKKIRSHAPREQKEEDEDD